MLLAGGPPPSSHSALRCRACAPAAVQVCVAGCDLCRMGRQQFQQQQLQQQQLQQQQGGEQQAQAAAQRAFREVSSRSLSRR